MLHHSFTSHLCNLQMLVISINAMVLEYISPEFILVG